MKKRIVSIILLIMCTCQVGKICTVFGTDSWEDSKTTESDLDSSDSYSSGIEIPNYDGFDYSFYYKFLSEFGNAENIDDYRWDNLSDLSEKPNTNIFSMIMLLDSEDQKIRLLEMFMNYDCESFIVNIKDFLVDKEDKRYFMLTKLKINQALTKAGFSHEYIEAFFSKLFHFDKVNLRFLYVIESFNYYILENSSERRPDDFTIVPSMRNLNVWISHKLSEVEKTI